MRRRSLETGGFFTISPEIEKKWPRLHLSGAAS
jgi:hypothetical protein